ncbi:MAG: hypothetical protein U1E74_05740 [Paenacidovorax caeni]
MGTVELAARAGMTRNTLRAVESGRLRHPSAPTCASCPSWVLAAIWHCWRAMSCNRRLRAPPARSRHPAPGKVCAPTQPGINCRIYKAWPCTKKPCGWPRRPRPGAAGAGAHSSVGGPPEMFALPPCGVSGKTS